MKLNRQPSASGRKPRAHGPERLDDASHGPLTERRVAIKTSPKRVARNDAGEETQRGAGVAGVKVVCRRLQRLGTAPSDSDSILAEAGDGDAETFEAANRAGDVSARGQMGHRRGAASDRAEHGVAVRDRFVTRNRQAAAERATRVKCKWGSSHGTRQLIMLVIPAFG